MHGFELLKEQHIPELNTNAKLFRHTKSGAELLSLENEDENKVFGITFRTPPPDSTGLPHIMEHSVLCGSRKYPVKEPFVELLKGSLNTFLNAMTFPDKTCYPVASQNIKDLYNLVDVYLDAVLYPRITPNILEQEGWHYELQNPDEPLAFKGVVFNEMKGAYSSPDNILSRFSRQSLFPDTPYGVDSGGDPAVIPDLTYQQFKHFHETFYHPSNARIVFYGDDDPEERLRFLDGYLKEFDAIDVPSDINLQPRFEQPTRKSIAYNVSEDESSAKKGMMTVNWMLTEYKDPETALGLSILNHILIGTPASPLRKALIDSGLGEDLTGGGIRTELRQFMCSTGLKGIAVDDADKVEELILATLKTLVQDGIESDMIEASVNTVEFRLREMNTGSYPRGLIVMLSALSTWLYDSDPFEAVAFETPLQSLKQRIKNGERYFEQLIDEHLIQNQHRSTVILKPDSEEGTRRKAAEEERLAQVKAGMSEEDIREVIEKTAELKRVQEEPDSPETLATIPMLTLDDLERENKLIPLDISQEGDTKILYHDLFTNGILYLDLGFDLHTLPQELLPYVPLFGKSLLRIGTEKEDFVKFSQRIGRKTGGISYSLFNSSLSDSAQSTAWLILRGKATMEQTDDLMEILKDMLLTVKLDNPERFKQLVLESKARKEANLIPSGHNVAHTRLGAHFTESGWLSEQIGGVESLFFTRKLAQEIEQDWSSVLAKLEAIRNILVNSNAMLCNVTLDQQNWSMVQPKLTGLLRALPAASFDLKQWMRGQFPGYEGLIIPANVNYVAKGTNLYDLGYSYHGSISVITHFLRTNWLWEKIRVQGGAYGGMCRFEKQSGVFGFVSYRDPNLLKTLDNYDLTAQFLSQAEVSQEELTKGIIGVIGQMDSYQLPDAKGYTSMIRHLLGETDELRQQRRDEVFSTTGEHFRAFAEFLKQVNDKGLVVVLGGQEAIKQANTERNNWLKTMKVL